MIVWVFCIVTRLRCKLAAMSNVAFDAFYKAVLAVMNSEGWSEWLSQM